MDLLRREISILRAELERMMSDEPVDEEPVPESRLPEEEPEYDLPGHLAGSSPIRWIEGDWVQSESPAFEGQPWEEDSTSSETDPDENDRDEISLTGVPIEFLREWREEQQNSFEQLALEMATLSSEVRRLRLELGNGHRANDIQGPATGYSAYDPAVPENAQTMPRLTPIVASSGNTHLLQIAIRVAAIIITIVVSGGVLYLLFS